MGVIIAVRAKVQAKADKLMDSAKKRQSVARGYQVLRHERHTGSPGPGATLGLSPRAQQAIERGNQILGHERIAGTAGPGATLGESRTTEPSQDRPTRETDP